MKEEELKKEVFELEQKIKEHDKKMINSTMNDNHQELLYVHSLLYNNKRVKKAELKGRQEQKDEVLKIIDKLKYDTFAMALKKEETLGTLLEYIKQEIKEKK